MKNVYLCTKHPTMKTKTDNICTILGETIRKTLTPLIPSDYILLDLPYHANIGDTLIWKGEEEFLKTLTGQCLGKHCKDTFDFRPLPTNCTILLHGGGNFGDLWRTHQEFRLEVMRLYPDNPIIILPQTIFYESDELFTEDVRKMNQHRHLTICARDNHSAELLSGKGFTGRLLTLPDMAFCINQEELQAKMAEATKTNLLLLREDKEQKAPSMFNAQCLMPEVSDWPQMQEYNAKARHVLMTYEDKNADTFFLDEFFPKRINAGIELASSYKEACSTRLHFAILRLLLGMPVKMLDNSYGKNLDFYNTWLKDSELANLLDPEEQKTVDLTIFVHKQKQECLKEHEHQIAKLKQEQEEQESRHADIHRKQEERISWLQQKADRESRKHRKYKKLFNASLVMLSLLVVTLVILFILNK